MIVALKGIRRRVRLPTQAARLAGAAIAVAMVAGCGVKGDRQEPDSESGYRVYVTSEASGDLVIIDGATRKVVGRAQLGKRPRGVRLSPDGRRLYVALSGTPAAGPGVDRAKLPPPDKAADGIGVFDLETGRLDRILRGVSDPEQLAVGGGRVFVSSEDTGALVVLDAASGRVLANVPVGEEPEGVTLSPDGAVVAVTSEADNHVAFIAASSSRLLGKVSVGKRPRTVTFSHDSRKAYVPGEVDGTISVIDVPNLRLQQSVRLAGEGLLPMDSVLSPDGKRLYVSTGRAGKVLSLDANTLSQIGAVSVGQRPWGLALSPDGRSLFSANGPSDDVSIVDTATMTIVATIPVSGRPWGMAVVRR